MDNERRILIVDGPEGHLQQLAMDLLGRDFDVHYANDLDEAQLIATEPGRKINAALVTVGLGTESIKSLAARFRISTDAIIPAGPRPPKPAIAALAHHGVRWHLWDDPADDAIRFVLSGVLFDHDPFELRYHLRVPTKLPAQFEIDGHKSDTTIRDIALGGACLLGGRPGNEGDVGELHFEFEGHTATLPTRTAWGAGDEGDELGVSGVSFQEVTPEAGEAIDALIASVLRRHQIQKPIPKKS